MGHAPIIPSGRQLAQGMPVWTAEITVDEELARGLIADQFPEVEAASLRRLGVGWDNTAWLVDETARQPACAG
jgi:hypothetical protein